MKNKNIKILLMSDIHVSRNLEHENDTYLLFKDGSCSFADKLKKKISEHKNEIDILICPGDITNKACETSFKVGWDLLNDFKNELNAKYMFCVPGNHDHKSRKNKETFDPKHHLQFIKPDFPFQNKSSNTNFWAWHWCHTEIDEINTNIFSINTSAYHGYGDECEHGRISNNTITQINDFIASKNFNKRAFNIIICHHHPRPMEYTGPNDDGEYIQGGSTLLKMLEESLIDNWLIIHGHRHFGEIHDGTNTGPITFSAGSLSAKLYDAEENETSNQFYVLELDYEKTNETDRIHGTYKTFEWAKKNWVPSNVKNLPHKGGFGSTMTPKAIAKKIEKIVNQQTPPFLKLDDPSGTEEINKIKEELKFISQRNFNRVLDNLRSSGYRVLESNSNIVEVYTAND